MFLYAYRLEEDLKLNIPKINKGLVWEYVPENQEIDLTKVQDNIQNLLSQYKNLNTDYRKYRAASPEYSLLSAYIQPYFYLAYLNENDITKSETFIKKAIDINPDNYQARIELGMEYLANGMNDKAVEIWKSSLPYIYDKSLKNMVQSKINEVKSK